MKRAVAMLVSVAFTGVAAVAGIGPSTPDDYSAVVERSPQAVFAAFAGLGAEGVQPVVVPGLPVQMTQRITRVDGEKVQLEVMVEGATLLTADVHLAPAQGGRATQVDAEIDVNYGPIERLITAGGSEMPDGVLDHGRVDRLFADLMTGMMQDVEAGRPILSVAELGALRTGRASPASPARAATPRVGSVEGPRPAAEWGQQEAISPQNFARPMVDARPAVDVSGGTTTPTPGGWGVQQGR